jgi:ribosomal protein L37AE/L43A
MEMSVFKPMQNPCCDYCDNELYIKRSNIGTCEKCRIKVFLSPFSQVQILELVKNAELKYFYLLLMQFAIIII